MNRHTVGALLALAGLLPCLVAAVAVAPERQGSSIAQLSWLAGCWESDLGDRYVEEQWMRPRGGTMLGMSRTVIGTGTAEFESMRIRKHEGQLIFTAQPSGQEGASFGSIELTKTKVVFENPAHDFPQRIIYRLNGDGSLAARIEGERNGELRAVDFALRRTRCADGGGR